MSSQPHPGAATPAFVINRLNAGLAVWAALIAAAALIGVARFYSPVPVLDMWDGYLDFFLRVDNGESGAWWAPHNEHRILLAHLLFWLDLRYLGGGGWSLVVVNCLLTAVIALMFYRVLRARAGTAVATPGQVALGLGLTGWLFSWMQSENLIWGFQIQFILAQLLPLCAFYWLHKSLSGTSPGRYFLLACAFGFAAIATMANGILALPLMLVYAVYLRQGTWRIATLSLLSAAALFLYFDGYQARSGSGSLLVGLREMPFDVLSYLLYYLGGPFFHLFGAKGLGRLAAIVGGVFFLVAAARFALAEWRRPVKDSLALMLLLFVLFVVGTAVVTAGGRVHLGPSQALSRRYTTPTLMAWAALMVLYAPAVLAVNKVWNRRAVLPYLLVGLLLTVLQLPALRSRQPILAERELAALALALGVDDQAQIEAVYPVPERALRLAEAATARRLGVFAMYPYREVKQQLGVQLPLRGLPPCQGRLDSVDAVAGDGRFLRVHGGVWIAQRQAAPQLIRFLDPRRRVVGYALVNTGAVPASPADGAATLMGYSGYLLAGRGDGLTMEGERPGCQMPLVMPPAGRVASGA